MKERTWKAERDLDVMRQERDKMRHSIKERDSRQDTYLSGWMKNLKPISSAIWGEASKVLGPLVRNPAGSSFLNGDLCSHVSQIILFWSDVGVERTVRFGDANPNFLQSFLR